MVSVEEATSIIKAHLFKPSTEAVAIHDAVDKVLAEKIVADRDFPPFDRVAMDGIAVRFDEWKLGKRDFLIESVQAAGEPAKSLMDVQHCIEVMTGAVLPADTDTVIRYEDLEISNNTARITIDKILRGQNIHPQGQDAQQNDVLLEPGIILSPAEIALLASVGKSKVNVFTFPKTAIVASGDELVDVHEVPEPHQIRRSNSYAIQSAIESLGGQGSQFHLVDKQDHMIESLKMIAGTFDVIILSGGVSKGKFDFIPQVLEAIGIKKLFHQVSQRPGKPFWFGVSEKGKIVFALPGNPVSTYMCFYRYIKPWLLKSFGIKNSESKAVLAADYTFSPDLTCFLQVAVKNENGKLMAYPDAGGGSGDFANLKNVTGFLELPKDRSTFSAGEVFSYFPFRAI